MCWLACRRTRTAILKSCCRIAGGRYPHSDSAVKVCSPRAYSSDAASWAQATVGAIAIVAGGAAVVWQVKRNRMELSEREARLHDGLARLLIQKPDRIRPPRQLQARHKLGSFCQQLALLTSC